MVTSEASQWPCPTLFKPCVGIVQLVENGSSQGLVLSALCLETRAGKEFEVSVLVSAFGIECVCVCVSVCVCVCVHSCV